MGRRQASPSHQLTILWHALDQPEVVHRIGDWLESVNDDFQGAALQVVHEKRLIQLAPNLNALIEADGPARKTAILTAGKLKCELNLPALLKLADQQDPDLDWPLAIALSNFPDGGRLHLRRIFHAVHADEERPAPWGDHRLGSIQSDTMTEFLRWQRTRNASDFRKKVRVTAAGGLAKTGDREAISFLVGMLYDPDERGGSYQVYGQSRNAAEALCDAFGWPVEPRSGMIERVRTLARDRLGS